MPHLYLPSDHTDADLVLAADIAAAVSSAELYVTWTIDEDGQPDELRTRPGPYIRPARVWTVQSRHACGVARQLSVIAGRRQTVRRSRDPMGPCRSR